MSDFRITYPSTDDTENFVSQQMQTVHVRVRGENDPEKQERIVAERKQQITQFARRCDNQHRLAGRQHSHFRVTQDGADLQYVNNTGQPFVYVDLPLEQEELPKREEKPVPAPPFRATAVVTYRGPGGGSISAVGGGSVAIAASDGTNSGGDGGLDRRGDGAPPGGAPEPDGGELGQVNPETTALIYLTNTPDSVKALWNESQYGQVLTMSAEPVVVGVVPGLDNVEDDFSSPQFDPLSRDVPIFAFGVTHTVAVPPPEVDTEEPGSTDFFSGCTFTQSFPDDIDAWPPLGPVLEDGSAAGTELGQGTLGVDRIQPLTDPFNPDNVLLCVRFDINRSTTGPRGEKGWSNSASITVHIYLIDEIGPVMEAARGGVSVEGADKFFTSPATNREDNFKQVSYSPVEGVGWFDDGPPLNAGGGFFNNGVTTKEQWSTVDFFKRSYVLDLVDGFSFENTTIRRDVEEPPEPEDRVVEEDVTSTIDLGFLGDASTSNVSGDIRLEVVAVPTIQGRNVVSTTPEWYVSTNFGEGLTDGSSVL